MKKIIITLAAIAAAFTFASCEKENLIKEENNGKTVLYASTAAAALTKTELSSSYQVLWSMDDRIRIIYSDRLDYDMIPYSLTDGAGTTEGVFADVSLQDGSYIAAYPSTVIADQTDWTYHPQWNWDQTYTEGTVKNMPMEAEFTVSGGVASPLKFKNLGGILRLKVKNTEGASLKSIVIDDGLKENNTPKVITLDCGTSGVALSSNGTEFLISMPAKTYSSAFKMTFTSTDGKTRKFTMSSKPMVINRSQITDATISVNFDAPIVTSFQVNASGKRVIFSKGNLYWDGDSYEFENDQLTFGYNDYSSHVSEFYFSSSESNARSQSFSSQGQAVDEVLFTNATETTANPNFTVAGETGVWRSLSKDEFKYLSQNTTWRTVGIGNSMSYIPVLILFPSDVTTGLPSNKSYITADKWADLEAKGCVALPLSYSMGDLAYYWTATSYDASSAYLNSLAGTPGTSGGSSSWKVGQGSLFYDVYGKSLLGSIRLVKDK